MKGDLLSLKFDRRKFLPKILLVLFFMTGSISTFCQASYTADGDYKKPGTWIFRGGLTGSVGYSMLYLSDNSRPEFASKEFYDFSPDYFGMVGGIVTIQPGFLSRRWAFIIDPVFAKYSYGNGNTQINGDIKTEVDIDAEMLRAPISVQYYFENPTAKLNPFVRFGYAYSYLFENAASFSSTNNDTGEGSYSNEFSYAKSQNSLALSFGSEVNIGIGNFSLEIVAEMGDGIHTNKDAWDFFGSDSRTTSLFIRMAILF